MAGIETVGPHPNDFLPQGEGQTWEIDLDSSEIPEVYDYTTGEYPDEAA